MTKTTQAIIVAAVTITAVVTTQTVWHHYRAPDSSRMSGVHVPLPPQQATEAAQAARDFLGALGTKDWETVAKFWPPDAPKGRGLNDIFTDQMKSYVSGLEITRLGTPYKEGPNSWVLVPYEVRFQNGNTQTNNLRMGKDRDGNWHWEGGF